MRPLARRGQALLEMALILAMMLVLVFSTLALVPVLRVRGEVEAASHDATARIAMFQAPLGSSIGQQANWLCTSSLAVAEYQLSGITGSLTSAPGADSCAGSNGSNGRVAVSVAHVGSGSNGETWRVCVDYTYPTNAFVVLLSGNGKSVSRQGLGTLIFDYCGQDEVDAFRTR